MLDCYFNVANSCDEGELRLVVMVEPLSKPNSVLIESYVRIQTLKEHISIFLGQHLKCSFFVLVEFPQNFLKSQGPDHVEEPVSHKKRSFVI